MSMLHRLYTGETSFDFVGNRRRWFTFSGVLLLIAVLAFAGRGLNLSVDFEGGTIVESPNPAGASVSDVNDAIGGVIPGTAKVQLVGDGDRVLVQTEALDGAQQDDLVAAVAAVAGVTVDDTFVEGVGPTFGREVASRALRALFIFLAVVVVFISFRFEWKMALTGLSALAHDLLLTFGVYALVGFEVTPATVIAVLTILGYSLYDTVVVFDKVTENVEQFGEKQTYTAIANHSMNEVLMRSINTSLTSLLPVGSLLLFGSLLFGAATLREFALALFIGIAAGTYSSIFIATPLLARWKEREEQWQRMHKRVARKGKGRQAEPEPEPAAEVFSGPGVQARPPKKRRRR
jgi:preprotein translocase subunit SecF